MAEQVRAAVRDVSAAIETAPAIGGHVLWRAARRSGAMGANWSAWASRNRSFTASSVSAASTGSSDAETWWGWRRSSAPGVARKPTSQWSAIWRESAKSPQKSSSTS